MTFGCSRTHQICKAIVNDQIELQASPRDGALSLPLPGCQNTNWYACRADLTGESCQINEKSEPGPRGGRELEVHIRNA
jgi:hypothetical protein